MRLETGWPWGGVLASARCAVDVEARCFSWQAPKPLNPTTLNVKLEGLQGSHLCSEGTRVCPSDVEKLGRFLARHPGVGCLDF